MTKNIIVGQSGGPTAVINGSLYGVVAEGLKHPDRIGRVYGMINGIEGFLQGHMMDIGALDQTNELEWYVPRQAHILAPAGTSCRRAWRTQYIHSFSRNLRSMASAISSISGEMIPWIRSANCPATPRLSAAISASSACQRPSTMTW